MNAENTDTLVERAETYYLDGDIAQAEVLYRKAFIENRYHSIAYGRLVQIAIDKKDTEGVKQLFRSHRAFAFEMPTEFRPRIQLFEMVRMRGIYSAALQAAINHQWAQAESQFSLLLGDEAYHTQAVGWLFRLAMQQKNFERAQFLVGLARDYTDNPAAQSELLAACVMQRVDQREPALAQIKKALTERGAYSGSNADKTEAQRMVYSAMIRLHEENDQCYLNAWKTANEARPYFPALPDLVLQYLAR